MCLLDDNDLAKLVGDPQLFSRFTLLEKERQVVKLHAGGGLSFRVTGKVLNITRQRAHFLYNRALRKMKRQLFEMVRNGSACPG